MQFYKLLHLLPLLGTCFGCLSSRSSSTSSLMAKDYESTEFMSQRSLMILFGVPLNSRHNFNQDPLSDNNDHNYTSAPGCPRPYKGHPWITYKDRCYLAGFPGPCPPYMKMFLMQGTTQGICDCGCFNQDFPWSQKHCHLATHFVHIANLNGTCHKLFFQGPCPSNHWLIIGRDGEPRCERRKCPQSTLKRVEYYTFYDEPTHHCAVNQGKCSPFHFYMTDAENWIPVCSGVIKIGPTQPPPASSPCKRDDILKTCLGKFDSGREVKKRRQVCHDEE